MDERSYWLGFSVFSGGIGPKRFQLLLEHFKSAEHAWNASENEIVDSGIGVAIAQKFTVFKQQFSLKTYIERLHKEQVTFITRADTAYPTLLRQIDNPPIVLYCKGDSTILTQNAIGVVGTRKITNYGREVTERITETLVLASFTIVSGLAFGVDARAHGVTIENGGKTIAVLGCGVNCCSPRENQQLFDSIIKTGGAIVSEYPLSAQPTKGSFPSRNRIIAGLSQAVIVTEGAEDSGALYTAAEGLKLGRPVFAVPGPITSKLSKGPLSLVAKGAKLVTSVEDILEELSAKSIGHRMQHKGETVEEQKVIDLLQNENLLFDELVKKTGFTSAQLGVVLSMMEMKGIIKENGGLFRLEQ